MIKNLNTCMNWATSVSRGRMHTAPFAQAPQVSRAGAPPQSLDIAPATEQKSLLNARWTLSKHTHVQNSYQNIEAEKSKKKKEEGANKDRRLGE